MLYGKEFMKDFKNQTSIPMALFCRNNKMEPSRGKDVPGMSFKLCNDFYPILTDVGLCMAKDSAYDLDVGQMKIEGSTRKRKAIGKSLMLAETTIMINNGDVLGTVDKNNPFMTILPRTMYLQDYDKVQLQINQNTDVPQILFGSDQEVKYKSIMLSPGNEYVINLAPHGQVSELDFKDLTLEQRKCRLSHETFESSTSSIYSKQNCKYDCYVSLAIETCGCIPWDFGSKIENVEACDVFGRTCFFDKMATLGHDSVDFCPHCIDECDKIQFAREVIDIKPLELVQKNTTKGKIQYCNQYVCMDAKGYEKEKSVNNS